MMSFFRKPVFRVECHWDDEAKVWFVAESNVPGLAAEADTVEAMNDLLRQRIPELLQLNEPRLNEREVPFELITRQKERLALAC